VENGNFAAKSTKITKDNESNEEIGNDSRGSRDDAGGVGTAASPGVR
jgi:hypothetical protein